MQQQQDGRFINVEQRCPGDAGAEQRGCQRAAPPWLGWGPPHCPLTVPVQGCGCQSLRLDPRASTELCRAGTESPAVLPQEPGTSAGPASTAQSHPGTAARFQADRIRATNPLPVAKSAQSSGLASSVSSCKGTQGHSQEGEALELRLVLAPSPARLCSAMPDPGTVPRQLGGRLCLGSALPRCLARGCQG